MKGIRNFKSLYVSVINASIIKLKMSFKVLFISIITVLLCTNQLLAQSKVWEGVGSFYAHPHQIVQMKDSSYWVAGYLLDFTKTPINKNFLTKFSPNGKELFSSNLPIFDGGNGATSLVATKDGGLLYLILQADNEILLKLDDKGNLIWHKTINTHEPGGIFKRGLAFENFNQNIIHFSMDSITMLDSSGKLLWQKEHLWNEDPHFNYQDSQKIILSEIGIGGILEKTFDYNGVLKSEKNIPVEANSSFNYKRCLNGDYLILDHISSTEAHLYRVRNGKKLWKRKFILKVNDYHNNLMSFNEDKNGNIILGEFEYTANTGIWYQVPNSTATLSLLDRDGNIISNLKYSYPNCNILWQTIETNDGHYLTLGSYKWGSNPIGDPSIGYVWLIKTKLNANTTQQISGKIIFDDNNNCAIDNNEKNSLNCIVQLQKPNGDKNYTAITDDGSYQILADTGLCTLNLIPPSPYVNQTCTKTIVVNKGVSNTSLNLFLQKTTDCPYLNVDIANLALRPCFDAVQVVNFCNHGSAIAQNAYIEVQLDANLTFQNSTKTAIPKGNNLYRFDLGNIPIDSCGQFTISTKVACDNSLLGKTLCNSAHIFPDSLCAPQDNGKIQVTGTCNGATIDFKIKNADAKAMKSSKNYIVIEDHVMFKQGSFNLTPNQVETVSIPAQAGKTYRIIAEQTNPIYGNLATIAFENCNVSASPTTGMINQFPQGDDSPFEDTDCRVVTASYDPNDKQAVPEGVNNQHFIAKNTDLEYMIRFQNKGTDTAFLVIIKDTLSQFLDPATIELGASSHPCKFDLTDRGIAKFIFSGINLPHEKVDKEGSNGFVKFRIKQRRDLPNGTVINNKAAIYFDYNDPIITNTTYHTIGENWLMIVPNKEVNEATVDITVFPNPFNESTRIEAQIGEEHNNLTFNLFDTNGRMVRSENFVGKTLDFQRNGLQNGFYFYEIKSDGKRLGTGKLVVF